MKSDEFAHSMSAKYGTTSPHFALVARIRHNVHGINASTITLRVIAGNPRVRRREPVGVGVPFPRGLLSEPTGLRLREASGRAIPLQVLVLDRWSDGSIRWALLRWEATLQGEALYEARMAPGEAEPIVTDPLVTELTQDGIRVSRAGAEHQLVEAGPLPFELRLVDSVGHVVVARAGRVEAEERGPLFTRVRVECEFDGPLEGSVLGVCRMSFFASSPTIRFDLTLRNPRRARHRGGFWELGDPGSLLLRGASVTFPTRERVSGELIGSLELGAPGRVFALPFELLQESSGGENWQSRTHVNREGVVPLRFRGYRARSGNEELFGLRAEPVLRLGSLALAVSRFWQNFPKSLEGDREGIALHLFPDRWADLHELQGGEQKTHTFFVCEGVDGTSDLALEWCRSPARVTVDPKWCCASGSVPYLVPLEQSSEPVYEELVRSAVEGEESFFAKRERSDEYGWRNFGDLHADHEETYYSGPTPIVSHYNNQYDGIAGFATQFLRSSDARWFELMDDLAAHVVDIDVYHTGEDKAAYNHGLFWHTFHYVDAGRSTHRSYPHAPGVFGGGPSNEHNYTTGLVLHYFLTGNPLSRETALELARWVVDMDDGGQTVFRWLAGGPTGLASKTADPAYHGPGRGAGNSVNALLDGFQLTRERRFLEKAEELIRRCIHPEEDLEARDLGNVELRWSYTVFLQKLGRYVDCKRELGELDSMHAWALRALLRYAHWMAEHEAPYLQRPEILEYPTETWDAQDIRKSDVLFHAALYVSGAERLCFQEWASSFRRGCLESLAAKPTRKRTRPVVILLTNGRSGTILGDTPSEIPTSIIPETARVRNPESFDPQKRIALRRLRVALVAGGIAAAAALLPLLRALSLR